MNNINLLLSQMVNTDEGEKFKIGTNDIAKMDVYDFKGFVADTVKNKKTEFNPTTPRKNTQKRKCIILVLKNKAKT